MLPTNLTFFVLPPSALTLPAAISEGIAGAPLRPTGPEEYMTYGFVDPITLRTPSCTRHLGDGIWLTFATESKLLPATVLNAHVAQLVEQRESADKRRVGRRERQRIRDDALHDLLPRSFVVSSHTDAYIDRKMCFIAINTASRKKAEDVVSAVRKSMGSFPALPILPEVSARHLFTAWLSSDAALPDGLALDDACELHDAADTRTRVKCQGQDLKSQEITEHLLAGKQCRRIALTYKERLSFVLDDTLTVRKLRFLDTALDTLENTERDSAESERDARFLLTVGEVQPLFTLLRTTFFPGTGTAPSHQEHNDGT